MLIGKVIADNRDKLCYYQKVALQEGFASELYAALTAVRNSGISSQDLLESSKQANVSLQMKAKDLALIYDGYLAALEGKHSDSSTRLYALAEFLKTIRARLLRPTFTSRTYTIFPRPNSKLSRVSQTTRCR